MEIKQEYINGCYTKYGTRLITAPEAIHTGMLPNGYFFVAGEIPEDGISVDVYKDKPFGEPLFMEHGFEIFNVDLKSPSGKEMIMQGALIRCEEMKLRPQFQNINTFKKARKSHKKKK